MYTYYIKNNNNKFFYLMMSRSYNRMINIIIIISVYYNSNIYYLKVGFNKNCLNKNYSPYHFDHHPGVDYLTCFEGTHHLHTGREGGREGGKEGGRKESMQLQQYCTFNAHLLHSH